jgi:hypothetical protein
MQMARGPREVLADDLGRERVVVVPVLVGDQAVEPLEPLRFSNGEDANMGLDETLQLLLPGTLIGFELRGQGFDVFECDHESSYKGKYTAR